MNGITHKQAGKWIHRRLDGLLNEKQLLLLEEHLSSCDSCRAYAAEMDLLPARLQNEFHARWDEKPDPSPKVIEHVTTKGRKIPMRNRIASGLKLFAWVATLVVLAFLVNFVISQLQSTATAATETQPADSSAFAKDRLIAFTSEQNGNFDIYTMHAAGSGLTNLTDNPAYDGNPFWSPDGRHIAFESDRSGISQIYLMDADGSNVVQLTMGEAAHYLPMNIDGITYPWSPDGSKIISLQNNPGEKAWTLISQDIKGENRVPLVTGQLYYNGISWSPDGKYIGYILDASPNSPPLVPDIHITDANGSISRDLKEVVPHTERLDSRYRWSSDGGSIIFTTIRIDPPYSTGATILYEYELRSDTLLQKDNLKEMDDWEEAQHLVTEFRSFEQSGLISVQQYPDGKGNTFDVDAQCLEQNIRSSQRGNFAIGAYCPDNQFRLYWANLDGSTVKQLIDLSNKVAVDDSLKNINWSPDDRYIAFNVVSPEQTYMYILDVQAALENPSIQPEEVLVGGSDIYQIPSWQPVFNNEVVEEKPTPEPTQISSPNGLIAFTSTQNGNSEIYTMRADGSGVTNLTHNPAEDVSPVWSPDGKRLAFVSNRDGNDNVYVMNADGSGLIRVVEDAASDMIPVWSPDGTKIAYTSQDPNENISKIYIVDSFGQNRQRLSEDVPGPALVWPEAWSPDGQYFFFHIDRQIAKVNASGDDITSITPGGDTPSQFVLSKDGSKLLYLDYCDQNSAEFCISVKSINEDGTNPETYATVELQQVCTSKETSPAGAISRYEMINWSPDRTKILFAFYCEENGGLFYIANADGSDFKPLTSYPVLFNASGFDWSPDSQSIIFSSALDGAESDSPYILNINDTLQNPSLRPTRLNSSASQISTLAWQPVSKGEVVEEKPTPTVTPQTSSQADNRLIAFSSTMDDNSDIYIMHADGSGLTNLTNHPADDISPFWSPDGKRIAFTRHQDGLMQIYLMDADGSNVIQLTDGEGDYQFDINGYTPWSPDGKKMLFLHSSPEKKTYKLYSMDVDGKNKTVLRNEPGVYLRPSWSADGEHVAFEYHESEVAAIIPHLFVVDKNGNNLTEITGPRGRDGSAPFFLDYYWSQDGTSIFFMAGTRETIDMYKASLDGSLTVMTRSTRLIIDWWNGITLQTNENGRSLNWLRPDGSKSALEVCPNGDLWHDQELGVAHKRSYSGNLVFGSSCSVNSGWMLYWANPDGTITDKLLNSPISGDNVSLFHMTWSPDDRFIAFVAMDDSPNLTDTLYVLDVAQAREDPSIQPLKMTGSYSPSWQPILNDEIVEEEPTPVITPPPPQANNRLLAFTSEQDENFDIYTMHPDGSELTNLTNNPAQDVSPVWSPDGRRIAFESDRSGFRQIFLMDADGSNVVQLNENEEADQWIGEPHNLSLNLWSPDGNKLIFYELTPGDEKGMLYIIDVNGENKKPLVNETGKYSSPSWSPDGKHIAFIAIENSVARIYVTDANGDNLTNVTKALPSNETLYPLKYSWSRNGQSIAFIASNWNYLLGRGNEGTSTYQWTAYEASLDGNTLVANASADSQMGGYWDGTYFLSGSAAVSSSPEFKWVQSDDTSTTANPIENCQKLLDSNTGDYITGYSSYKQSSNGNVVIGAYCPNGDKWLFWANSEGIFIPLLNSPIHVQSIPSNAMHLWAPPDFIWSSDDKYIAFNIFSSGKTDMYIVNVNDALQNPSIQPFHMAIGNSSLYYSPVWQPMP